MVSLATPRLSEYQASDNEAQQPAHDEGAPSGEQAPLCFLLGIPVERKVEDKTSESHRHKHHGHGIYAQAEPNGRARDSPCNPAIQSSDK